MVFESLAARRDPAPGLGRSNARVRSGLNYPAGSFFQKCSEERGASPENSGLASPKVRLDYA